MKAIIICAILSVCLAAPRQKRLTVGTVSVTGGVGGNAGCVVTGNVLYANGFRLRELTSSEQQELKNYQSSVEQYKAALRQALKDRRDNLKARMSGKKVKSVSTAEPEELPKAPEKPSFCSAEDTTQYYFDGCMIQNNKVYVGREYARDLSPSEIEELKEFDAKQTVYQEYVQKQVQQQVKNLFGGSDFFSSFLTGDSDQVTSTAPATTELPENIPEQPIVPNFCTAIY